MSPIDKTGHTPEEVADIEQTLVFLLHEITSIDTGATAPVRGGYAALGAHRAPARLPGDTSAQLAARNLSRSPIREACAAAISVLGVRLFEIGGKSTMLASHRRVVARGGRHRARWSGIIDQHFHGIGG